MFMNRKKGFTLIELLVVIAIIALLLAILMPSLKKAKKIARDAVCRSNLKHWGAIWKVYTHENDDLLPDGIGFQGFRRDWIVSLREDYPTGQDSISQCPMSVKYVDYPSPIPGGGGIFSPYRNILPNGSGEFNSYGINLWSYSGTSNAIMGSDGKNRNWKRFEVGGASTNTIPFFMDSAFAGAAPHYDAVIYEDGMNMHPTPSTEPLDDNGFEHVYDGIRQFPLPRHGSGARVGTNVLFFDLSVRHVMVKEIWSLKWHRKFETQRWRTDRATIWPGDGTGIWLDKLSEDF